MGIAFFLLQLLQYVDHYRHDEEIPIPVSILKFLLVETTLQLTKQYLNTATKVTIGAVRDGIRKNVATEVR